VDAAVVLSGDPGYERTGTAAELVRSGRARLLILTGGEPGPGDSSESLREKAVALGVPADRIHVESVSRSTRQNVVAVLPLLQEHGVRSVALVTSPSHQRRAYYAARRAWPAGIRILNRPARASGWWAPPAWWAQTRMRRAVCTEYVKLAYYALRGWA
jgi:uncharacterized SAM-binding protein YcdF (DUF218 family)